MTTTKSVEEQLIELQHQFKTVQKEKEEIQKENEEIKKKYEDLRNEQLKDNITRNRHDNEFWLRIKHQLSVSDTDTIKLMIKNKTLDIDHDVDKWGSNIMMIASKYGCYDVVQLCINSGANIDQKDRHGKTAVN